MDIQGKIEDALVAVASDGGMEELAELWQGHDFEEHPLPYYGLVCITAVETHPHSGRYRARCRIVAHTTADRKRATETTEDDPTETHREMVKLMGLIFGAKSGEEGSLVDWRDSEGTIRPGLLTEAADDFTATMIGPLSWDKGTDGRSFWTSVEFDLGCCPSDLD